MTVLTHERTRGRISDDVSPNPNTMIEVCYSIPACDLQSCGLYMRV